MTAEAVLRRSQETRRRRILEAAIALAAEGGYDAVQMRDVAAAANVALGTLYRYFPSKDHLLVSAMLDAVTSMGARLDDCPPRGETAADRVTDVLQRATRAWLRQTDLTAAMLRAVVSADRSLGPLVTEVRRTMSGIITGAVHPGEPTERDQIAARILEYAWMGSLVSWLNGVLTVPQVLDDVETAARMLVRA